MIEVLDMSPTTILLDVLLICSYIIPIAIAIAVSKKFFYRTHRAETLLSQGYPCFRHRSRTAYAGASEACLARLQVESEM